MKYLKYTTLLLFSLFCSNVCFADIDLSTAVMGTENFSTTSNCWTGSSVSTTTTSSSKYAAYCSSNITGSTSGRVIGTIILVVNVPETVSAQEIFSYSQISGTTSTTTNAVGLGINSSRQLIGYWNGSAWSNTSTIDISSGEHVVIFKTNNNGSYIYIDNASTYIQMSALKTTATSKNGFEFGFTDYIKKFYAFDSDVDASSLFEAMSSTSYSVTCNSATNGSVTSNVSTAKEGSTVTLTVSPNTGYKVKTLSVADATGATVATSKNTDGTYSFTMPASDVTVTPTFTIADNSDEGSSVSKTGYQLVFSSETADMAGQYLTLSDAEKTKCTGSFVNQDALENKWEYCTQGTAGWKTRMGTDISEQRQMQGFSNETLNMYAKQVTSASDGTSKFLTSGIQTKDYFKYGIIEVKAKCNAHTSNFPAIWIMPEDHASDDEYTVPWPACGECDIMEQIGSSSTAYGTVHTGIRYEKFGTSYTTSGSKYLTDAAYHIYTLVWDESSLTWYYDGTQLWKYSKDTSLNEELQYQQFPYNKPYRIILDQAVGKNSSWGAEDPDASYTYDMDVAYVRVFQKTAGYTDPTCSFQDVTVNKTYQIKASTDKVLAASSSSTGATISGASANSTDALQQWTVMGSAASGYYFILANTSYYMQNGTSSVTTATEAWKSTDNNGNQDAQTFYYTSDNKLYTFLNNSSSTRYYLVLNSTGSLSTTTSSSSATTFTFEEIGSTPTTTYTITCNSASNGSVSATPTSAASGETVTLTVTPNSGYVLSSMSVKDASDNEITVTNNTFTMPASNVTVTATFTESSAISLPTDRPYAMKVNGADLYLDMENTITETDNNECVTLQSSPYPVLFAEGSSTDTWTIQSQGTITNYLAPGYDLRSSTSSTTLGWSTTIKSTSYDWTIACPSTGVYNFARSDGNSIYYNTLSSGNCLYCNSTKAEYATTTGTVADFVLVPMYSTTISSGITGGTVSYAYATSYNYAAAGQTVTLTETPAEGYTFGSYNVTYVDSKGSTQSVDVTDGTFTMPEGDVTVNATFIGNNETLDLTDDAPTIIAGTYKAGNVTYTRTVNNYYAAFNVPFDVDLSSASDNFQAVYTLAGFAIFNINTNILTTFYERQDMSSTLKANTPFLAVMTLNSDGTTKSQEVKFASTSELTYASAMDDPDVQNMDLYDYGTNGGLSVTSSHYKILYGGTLNLSEHQKSEGYYTLTGADGSWGYVDGTLKPFRYYLIMNSLSSSAKPATLVSTFIDDSTGINEITSRDADGTIYDISGRKQSTSDINALPKGIYIKSGKKIIVK